MGNIKKDIEKFRNIQKLKFTYRFSGRIMDGEKESTADHTWCCFIVADYLLEKLNAICPGKYSLDKLKIYELISYHDLLEAEIGDIDLDPSARDKHETKSMVEAEALPKFLEKIPEEIRELYKTRLSEYEERESLESRFVKLVDVVECVFQCFFHKDLFKNWDESYFIQKREKHFDHFPELKFIHREILEYFRENGYFCA